jgi:hypothetical protein
MAKRNHQFQTIRTEGAILPPDILRRIASLKVDGATPDAYHLPPGHKPNEAISQSWNSLQTHWQAFQEAREQLPDSDETGTAVTNERWLLPLFKELDYGRLITTKSPEIDERVYPIERFYNHAPIHLIGCKLPLDRRSKGARGAATASPHSMVQEFLNRSDDHLWAFVSNGLQLRILRDNISLSRQAYVEFDLEAMMEGEVYADFALLWLLCHQSRVEADKPENCWLEQWSKLAQEQGTRVLNALRDGVGKAIEALGRGFIGHPRNDQLVEKLRSGRLSKDDFYRQLLRTVYRLLFLFVAEDRELLHPPDAEENACQLYDTHYSTRRLRELANKIRGSKHSDLWHSLSLVFDALGKNEGCPQLALGGLGSFLWRSDSTSDLLGPAQIVVEDSEVSADSDSQDAVLITNDDLLHAIRELAFVEQDRVLRAVDYRNLGSEELGSVYESLLELHPVMNADAKTFDLGTAAGNERKTTGSYYTPDSLVQCLLDSALDPVVEDRLKGKRGADAEQAILETKVCDPACGSGHFLIAAAHRLARHLARVRTGETEPSPEDYQHALRDVIGKCIYGVDINPMAVELCKVSLWMEAIEPGKPLSFLDSHIRCGNSLLGTTPALLASGIPDDAFKPIEGDVKAICSELKKDNKKQREDRARGQGMLFDPPYKLGNLPSSFANLASSQDDSVEDVVNKEEEYARLVSGADYQNARLLADTWCAVFVWKKDESDLGRLCPTENDFRRIENNPHSILPHVRSEVRRLADQYQFFHWHLAFPDVFVLPEEVGKAENEQTGWSRGFDVVLGNPPWDRVKLQEKEWFAERAPEIANAKNTATRKKLIAKLEDSDFDLFSDFTSAVRKSEGTSVFLRFADFFPLCGRGDVNVYSVFAELGRLIVGPTGRSGMVVPSGIATDNTTKFFFQDLVQNHSLVSLFDFENCDIFPNVHSSYKFCLLTLRATSSSESAPAKFAFFCHKVADTTAPEKRFELSANEIALLNPNTKTCPVFRTTRDFAATLAITKRLAPLSLESASANSDEWGFKYREVLHMAHNANSFASRSDQKTLEDYFRLYEAKMIHQFDHRWATFLEDGGPADDPPNKNDPHSFALPRYYVPQKLVNERIGSEWTKQWLLSWRAISRATDSRTLMFAVVPRSGLSNSMPLAIVKKSDCTSLVACLNSYAADYSARQRLGGANLTMNILRQVSVVAPGVSGQSQVWLNESIEQFCCKRVLELTYTAWDLEAFALDFGYDGPPFRWDDERRFLLRCELDAAYFHLYLGAAEAWGADNPELREMFPTPRDAVDYIMETFPIVKRKDIARTQIKNDSGEVTTPGTYITKDTILAVYDEMQTAIYTGTPYQTHLNPQPGPPTDEEGNFIPSSNWDESNWPGHIHVPKATSNSVSAT